MGKPTLYMETTVPSYLLVEPSRDVIALARQDITRTWWHRDQTRFAVFVSDIVLEEAGDGDREYAKRRREFLEQFSVLEMTSEAEELTALYMEKRIVPARYEHDAAHLALATVHEIQFLCTWNFRHLANALALKRFRQINEKRGLFVPQVCTPEQLLGE